MNQMPKKTIQQDQQYMWHPFTSMASWNRQEPLVIERAEGVYLIDDKGKRYIDGVSSLWCNVHGHRVKRIDEAIKEQLKKVAHTTLLGLASGPAAELAGRLVKITPRGLDKVFFSDDGSTAVEVAIKIAFGYWQNKGESRKGFVALRNGYHGDTLGAVSLGGIELFHEIYGPLLFETFLAPSPYCYRCGLGLKRESCGLACATRLEAILQARAGEIAAMAIEPVVQGAGGMIVAPEGYLKRVREITKRHGVLLIADEVATGFGRTGTMFACEQEAVEPDIMCLSKGITGGYLPLAATLVREEIFEAFSEEDKTFYHGHTYTGNALACAAGLGSLDVFEQERLIEQLGPKMERFAQRLKEIKGRDFVGDVRYKGLMGGIELVAEVSSKRAFSAEERIGARVCEAVRKHGVILRPLGDVVVVMPPLSVSLAEIDILFDSLGRALEDSRGLLELASAED